LRLLPYALKYHFAKKISATLLKVKKEIIAKF